MVKFGHRKAYLFFLACLGILLGLVMIYSDQGLMRLYTLKGEEERLRAKNGELHEENRRLSGRIERIKTDRPYIEDEARKKLGLIREDETIYRLHEEPDVHPSSRGNQPTRLPDSK